MKKFLSKYRTLAGQHKGELFFIFFLLLISGLAAGWNMFHYPSYFEDEGTYMARAVAIAYHHSLAPYTYWYDHAPGGWIIIALWLRLTGGISTFGSAINSGRVLMLLVHLTSTVLLYLIAKHYKLSKPFIAIIIAFFSLSPLAITLQRMVFLDNLMVVIMLAAVYLGLRMKNVRTAILSGCLLGIAALTKETAIFFIPGMLVLLFQKKPKSLRKFISLSWLMALAGTILTYPIFALLRGEFFPMHSLLGGKSPHVSLVTTLLWQDSRKGGVFYASSSQFIHYVVHSWLFTDPILITAGFASSVILLIISFRKRQYVPIVVMTFGYIYYLIRGTIVNDQYLIPLIPFFALNIGIVLYEYYQQVEISKFIKHMEIALIASVCAVSLIWDIKNPDLYVVNATAPQMKAIDWLQTNTNKSDLTEIDSYAMGDLLYDYGPDIYKNYGYQDFWEVDQDPELTTKTLHDSWHKINYILVTPDMLSDVGNGGLPLTQDALNHSTTIEKYTISLPSSGVSGYLYKHSLHKYIIIATEGYIDINKVQAAKN